MPVQIALDENRALKRSFAPLTMRGPCPGVRSFEVLGGDTTLIEGLITKAWHGADIAYFVSLLVPPCSTGVTTCWAAPQLAAEALRSADDD